MSNRNFLSEEWGAVCGIHEPSKATKPVTCSWVVGRELNRLEDAYLRGNEVLRSVCEGLAKKHGIDLEELEKLAKSEVESFLMDGE